MNSIYVRESGKLNEHIRGMPPDRTQPAIRVLRTLAFPGYVPGMHQPALVIELILQRHDVEQQDLMAVDSNFKRVLPEYNSSHAASQLPVHPLLHRILRATSIVLSNAGMPVFTEGFVIGSDSGPEKIIHLAVPAMEHEYSATELALSWVIRVLNYTLDLQPIEASLVDLPAITEKIGTSAPQGMNTPRFLQAAHDFGIPWRRVVGNVFQFGWGAKARWLDSTFTDVTANISTKLARDKRATAWVLRQSGIPVPAHAIAANQDDAVTLAEQLGYPVVVKPADQDGGRGVSARLRHPDSVRKAFSKARKLSDFVLVEKHFEGNDYRLQVFQGEVFWATHRVPAGVTGDGASTVAELLAVTNADPRRGAPGGNTFLKRIALDEEVLELLEEQGLSLADVPDNGQFVRLRGAANVASGGVPVPVLEEAHPDNLALGIRAARILRLDLAGIDLLIPDIRRSWLETGAVICEVNAQPQVSPHLPAYLLQRLVKDQGRIPVIIVLGDAKDETWVKHLTSTLSADGRCVGVATPDGVKIGMQTVVKGPCDVFQGGLALINDTQVELAVIFIADQRLLGAGLPVDRFDVLVLAGPPTAGNDADAWERWEAFAHTLIKHCSGPVIVNQDCKSWVSIASRLNKENIITVSPIAIATALQEALLKTER